MLRHIKDHNMNTLVKSHKVSLAMRFLLTSLLALLLVNTILAETFKGEKLKLGKSSCTCTLTLNANGNKCSGKGGCDKKCTGSGTVQLGIFSFTLNVKKGKAKISKCSAEEVESTTAGTASGSGEQPVTVLPPGSGSGSGEQPVTIFPPGSGSGSNPPTGSGSGPNPPTGGSGSGPAPPMGGEMQCKCKCDCPDGSGECDCDCNCPMQSSVMNCAYGFTKVCPMSGDMCPMEMEMVCPMGIPMPMPMPLTRMENGGGYEKGCQCVPDFLMALLYQAMAPPAATRLAPTNREKVQAQIKVGKKECKCSFDMQDQDGSCMKSKGSCDKKCTGAAKGVELMDGMYVMDIKVKKGKVTISKCKVSTSGTGSGSGTLPGSGSGTMPGSGSGAGGMGGMGSRCACVGMGGPGILPYPPTGSGSGSNPPTGSGSGSNPPTGSGSGSGPITLPTQPPTGSGSGSGPIGTVTRVKIELYTGSSEEAVEFDGQTVTLEDGTQFNPAKPIKVVIHGWEEAALNNDGEVVDNNGLPSSFSQLYQSNGMDYTVLGVHWVPLEGWNEELMNSSSTDAGNTIGLLLKELSRKFSISSDQIHVIGFSMGTVVTSKTAKKIQELGMSTLGRITLLDPCPYQQASVISKTDAEFVEAIHTSSQGICQETPLAHVDYYPNGGDAQLCGSGSCTCWNGGLVCDSCYHGSPRCLGFFGFPDWVVNHFRAVELYKESIGRPSAFLSWKCSESYPEFVENSRSCAAVGDSNQLVPMGEHSLENGRPEEGLYFLKTAGVSPFYDQ